MAPGRIVIYPSCVSQLFTTGLLFQQQTVGSLIEAVQSFERQQHRFDPMVIRKNAERFSPSQFRSAFDALRSRFAGEVRRLDGLETDFRPLWDYK